MGEKQPLENIIKDLLAGNALTLSVLESLRDGVSIVDTQGTQLYVNKALATLLGYSKKELEGGAFAEKTMWDEAERQKAYANFRAVLDGELIPPFKLALRNKKGQPVHIELNGAPLRLNGAIAGGIAVMRDISATRQLEQFSKLLQYTIDHASFPIYWIRANGTLAYTNGAAAQSLGYTKDEMLTLSIFDIDPNFSKITWGPHWEKSRGKSNYIVKTTHRKKTGKKFPVEVSVNYVEFEGEEYHFSFVRDISEREKIHAELTARERQLSVLFNNLPGMAYSCANDRKWTMRFVSSGAEALTGFTAEELQGNAKKSYADIIIKKHRNKVWTAVQKAVEQHKPFQLEYQIQTKGGLVKWVWEQGVGVYDATGVLLSLEGIVLDITDRRELQERNRVISEILRQGQLMVAITGTDGIIEYVNPAWQQAYGWTGDEVVGKVTPRVLKSGKFDEATYAKLWKTITKGKPYRNEFHNVTKDGREVVVDQIITPVQNAEGEITAYVGIQLDITRQKKTEQELKEKIAETEKLMGFMVGREQKMIELKNKLKQHESR